MDGQGEGWTVRSSDEPILSPARIALIYLVLGSLALVFSDVLLARLFPEGELLHTLQAIKGAVEVVLTAALIYGLVAVYQRSVERERRQTEQARDRFAFLNSLLRHHVLNRMNIVQGYVGDIRRTGSADPGQLETIHEQSDAIVDLVENIRTLSRGPGVNYERHRLDLTTVLAEAVESARSEYPNAEFAADVPGGVHVEADDSLSLVFENLLRNAVEHNDAPTPRVEVDVTVGEDRVAVGVADNGPGISGETLETATAGRGRGDEGVGLFLVRRLVSRYDGEVRFDEQTDDGARVVVELPRSTAG